MRVILLLVFTMVLNGCGEDDRDINATFNSYCHKDDSLKLYSVICENEKYRKVVVAEYKWFQKEADIERLFYRFFGVLVIVLSISIPLVTQGVNKNKDFIVTCLSVLIAIGTSLSAFFNWGENWAQYRSAEYEYRAEIRKWDMAIAKLVHGEGDDLNKIDQVHEYTRSLILKANDINMKANKQFFESTGGSLDSYLEDY